MILAQRGIKRIIFEPLSRCGEKAVLKEDDIAWTGDLAATFDGRDSMQLNNVSSESYHGMNFSWKSVVVDQLRLKGKNKSKSFVRYFWTGPKRFLLENSRHQIPTVVIFNLGSSTVEDSIRLNIKESLTRNTRCKMMNSN